MRPGGKPPTPWCVGVCVGWGRQDGTMALAMRNVTAGKRDRFVTLVDYGQVLLQTLKREDRTAAAGR